MKRRDFIQKTSIGAVFACCSPVLFAKNNSNFSKKTKVFIVRGNNHQQVFDRGIQEFGGFGNFIKKGQSVVLKPDISRNALPEEGLTTNPILVKNIIRQCYKNESGPVFVFDHCIEKWTKCYKNSGIERAAKDAAARVLPGNHESYYREQTIKGASVLTHACIHTSLDPSCLLIDVPILKTDKETTISGGLKNLMGCVLDQDFYRQNGLHRCIAEFLYYKKPELTVIDASHLLKTVSGEKFNAVQIISTDVLAADAVACRLLGVDPHSVEHLNVAASMGFGIISDTEIEMKDITV